MIELYQLEQLIAFAECGTLSLAAENMHISQPSLTRTMKKLEDDFGVPLFSRTKNKIELNDNGKLAVSQAKKVIEQKDDMLRLVRMLDKASQTITLGSCAPVPLNDFVQNCSIHYPNMTLSSEMKETDTLLQGLYNDTYQFIILPFVPDDKSLIIKEYGQENLYFALPESHPLSDRKEVSFNDMNGYNMIVFSEIGFWHSLIVKEMPSSKFIMQSERSDFEELIQSSTLPYFVTDVTFENGIEITDRKIVSISDSSAHAEYYLVCKKQTKKRFEKLV